VKDPRLKRPETSHETSVCQKREREGGGEHYLKRVSVEDPEEKKQRLLQDRHEERQKRLKKMEKSKKE
jgi:hypothetical protein